MMKKMWIWICIILIVAVGIYIFYPIDKLIVGRNSEALNPKYAAFQEINEHYKSNVFEVSLVAQVVVSSAASPNPIRIFSSVNDQLIIDCDATVDEETKFDNRYYKIDKTGTVTGSIYAAGNGYWRQFINDFMVYTSDKNAYYNTWPLNGDTTKRKMIELNADSSWTDEKVEATISKIKTSAKYWFFSSVVNNGV